MEKEYEPALELILITRDSKGNAIGSKNIKSDKGIDLYDFYLRIKGKPKKKKVDDKEKQPKKKKKSNKKSNKK